MGGADKRKRKRDMGRDRFIKGTREAPGNAKRKKERKVVTTEDKPSMSAKAEDELLGQGVKTSGFACICNASPCYCGAADEEPDTLPAKRPDVKACYNCGEEGHLSASCTQPRSHNKFKGYSKAGKVCFKCREEGHFGFECTAGKVVKKKKGIFRRDIMPLPEKKAGPNSNNNASELKQAQASSSTGNTGSRVPCSYPVA